MPRLQVRLDFLQFKHIGAPSSHFKCLCLHVRQPVRTRRDFCDAAVEVSASVIETGLFCTFPETGVVCEDGCLLIGSTSGRG
jgi:hypothetical protein